MIMLAHLVLIPTNSHEYYLMFSNSSTRTVNAPLALLWSRHANSLSLLKGGPSDGLHARRDMTDIWPNYYGE